MPPENEWARDLNAIVELAISEAEDHGLAGMDALHIAAAMLLEADEFVTTEKHGRPIYRVDSLQVTYLGDMGASEPMATTQPG